MPDGELLAEPATQRLYWVGRQPPHEGFVSSMRVADVATGFRALAVDHRSYDSVHFIEEDLGRVRAWPVVVDELFRITKAGGLVTLRYSLDQEFETHHLMNLVRPRTDPHPHIEDLPAPVGQRIVTIQSNATPTPPRPTSITIGVLSDSARSAAVDRLLESVAMLDPVEGLEVSVVVCAPGPLLEEVRKKFSQRLAGELHLVDDHPANPRDLRSFTRKKNLVIAASPGELLAILHERYWLPKEFLSRVVEFGTDVDVIVPRQQTPSGFRFPSSVATGGLWTNAPLWELPADDFSDTAYINGGIIIARSDLLRQHPYNELLGWGESEDVEISRRLSAAGVVPRHSPQLIAYTTISREDQIAAFARGPRADSNQSQLYPPGESHLFSDHAPARGERRRGVWLADDWRVTPDGAVWGSAGLPEIAIHPQQREEDAGVPTAWTVSLAGNFAELASAPTLEVNGTPAHPTVATAESLSYTFTSLLPQGGSLLLMFVAGWRPEWQLRSFSLESPETTYGVPLSASFASENDGLHMLATGWGRQEPWGRWSEAEISHLRVRLRDASAKDLRLAIRLRTLVPKGRRHQRVTIEVNGRSLAIWRFSTTKFDWRSLRVPADALQDGVLDVGFRVSELVAPVDLGLNADKRSLGVAVSDLRARALFTPRRRI